MIKHLQRTKQNETLFTYNIRQAAAFLTRAIKDKPASINLLDVHFSQAAVPAKTKHQQQQQL